MNRSLLPLALLLVGCLATACKTPAPPDVWLEGPVAWVGEGMVIKDAGFLPGPEDTVVYTAPDEPGEVALVLLGPGGGEPSEFVVIPAFPTEGATAGEAATLLTSLGLVPQFYAMEGTRLKLLEAAPLDSAVVCNHPLSPAGTSVAPGTTVGVVIIISRAPA